MWSKTTYIRILILSIPFFFMGCTGVKPLIEKVLTNTPNIPVSGLTNTPTDTGIPPSPISTDTPTPTGTATLTPSPLPPTDISTPTDTPGPTPCHTLSILSPGNGDKVDVMVNVQGCGTAANGELLFALTRWQGDPRYWITNRPPDISDGHWSVTAQFGESGSKDSGKSYEFCIVSTKEDLMPNLGKQLNKRDLPEHSTSDCITVIRK